MGKNEELEKDLKALQDRVQIEKSASVVEFNSWKKKCEEKEQNLLKEQDKRSVQSVKEVKIILKLSIDRCVEVEIRGVIESA